MSLCRSSACQTLTEEASEVLQWYDPALLWLKQGVTKASDFTFASRTGCG